MIKKIGLLTSGGDCAGLNAAMYAVVYRSINHYNWEVFGILNGTTGLMKNPVEYKKIGIEFCNYQALKSGGTFLGSTNKDNPFNFVDEKGNKVDRSEFFAKNFKSLELDALIGIGGDGSMKILHKIASTHGINFVGIPKTIDNDLEKTDLSIGFNTAVSVATEAIDRLQPTAYSHDRVIVLEVMGRDAGHIALASGFAGGVDAILIPEIPYSIEKVYKIVSGLKDKGKKSGIIVVAESVRTHDDQPVILGHFESGKPRYGGIAQYLSEKINHNTKVETRFSVLGHVQRGCEPTAQDRILATTMGIAAVDLVATKKFNRMVAWQDNQVIDVDIGDAIKTYRCVDKNDSLIKTALGLGIYVGEIS